MTSTSCATHWLDSPLAQKALEMCGGPQAAASNPAEFLGALAGLIEASKKDALIPFLAERGLTVGQLVDLAADVAMHEPEADLADEKGSTGLRSPEARNAVIALWVRGLAPELVARVLELPEESVRTFLARRTKATPYEREIVAGHLAGQVPAEIARGVGVADQTVHGVLGRLGFTPHRKEQAGSALRQQVVSLYRSGKSYGAMMEATGASRNQVRNALRRASERGELPSYGKRERDGAPAIRAA